MENFLPSEVARLVLGYLEEQGCARAYNEFLKGCRHLEECRGRNFNTRIMGLSLCDILDEFCSTQSYILEIKCGEEFKRQVVRCTSLLERVKLFVENNIRNGVFTENKTEKASRSGQAMPRNTSKVHKSRYVRSNSCDSIITIKSEKSYSQHRAVSNARSAESLAEATHLADLPGNKGYSRNSLNKSADKSFRSKHSKSLDLDELEFRKALGLVKHSQVPGKSANNKKTSTKIKQSPAVKKSHAADPFPSDSLNVTTIANALLDCTELHEKLAENINKLYNSSTNPKVLIGAAETNKSHDAKEDPLLWSSKETGREPNEVVTVDDDVPQLDTVIKSIVEKTEKDPIFDQFINEVLAASVDTSSESDLLSRPGTSTPEQSCPSQVNESSPTASWVSKPGRGRGRQKQASINMLSVSPHKSHRRYPRGGKRMDILRENYKKLSECANEDDPAPSAKSETPPHKSGQNIIILSNEIVQTHILPNNGPVLIQKAEECSDKLPEALSAGETSQVGSSSVDAAKHPAVDPKQKDGPAADNVNLRTQPYYRVPFVPAGVQYYTVHNPESHPPQGTSIPEAPVDKSTMTKQRYDQMDASMSQKDRSSLRTFRRTVVTGKPPDLVISKADVTKRDCFSKEEIMKMPTIIMIPSLHLDTRPDSTKPNQTPSADKEPKSTSSIVGESSQNINSAKKLSTKPGKRARALSLHQPKSDWSINASSKNIKNSEASGIQTLADVASALHPVPSNETKPLKTYIKCISSNETKKVRTQSHLSLASSSCVTAEVESQGNVMEPPSVRGLPVSRDSIRSNPSSEDDRFVIDERQQNVEANRPLASQTVSASVESKMENLAAARINTAVITDHAVTNSQDTDVTEGFEIKKNTPDLIICKRSSVSTPRRSFSHVRVLDFNTPPRTSAEVTRKTQSSPKQSLSHKCRDTVQKSRNVRPKAHSVKSQLFPTIPEKKSKCKVMKPKSRSKSKDKISTEVTVSNVWDDVQGMGQILKDEHSADVEEKSSDKEDSSSKGIVGELPNTSIPESTDGQTENDKKKLSDSEIEKKEKERKAAIEWARIRNIDKRSWDQEMRSVVALSQPVVIPKTKQTKKVRRRITKSSIPAKVSKDHNELSKSTEDEGRLLEKALNKSVESPLKKDEIEDKELNTKEENSAITNQNDNLMDNVETQPLCKTSLNIIDVCEESEDCVIVSQDQDSEVVTKCAAGSDHVSNKDFLLQVKHLRDSIKEKSQVSLNLSKEVKGQTIVKSEHSLENYSESFSKSSKDLKHGQSNGNTAENIDVAGPCSLKMHQTEEIKPREQSVEIHSEPPVPPVKITPDMPREHDFHPLNAKCNLASLLDTPFKCGILDLHLETPKFISPGFLNDIGLSTFKLLDMPTPNFPTPRVSAKDCTPGSCSSRPTDYSGGSSYYKPDEIEFNVDIAGPSRKKKVPVLPLTPLKEKEVESDGDTIPQRILRPRRTPKVYYPQTHPKVASKNTSYKSEPIDTKTKTPAKIIESEKDANVSSDSSPSCSTCSSSNSDDSLSDEHKTIITSPVVTKKYIKSTSQTRKYSTSTPKPKYENNPKSGKRLSSNNNAAKVKRALQNLKDKRLRAISKVTSSNDAPSNNDKTSVACGGTPHLGTQTKNNSTSASNSKHDASHSPPKGVENLRRLELEEKRLRVISKLNSSKFLPNKKDSNIAKRSSQNSKKNTKSKENIKNPSPIGKASDISQQTSTASKSAELTDKLTVSSLKSRRKSSTPRKLPKVLHESVIASSLTAEIGETSADHPTVTAEQQIELIKENRIDTKMNQKVSMEEGDVDRCKNTNHRTNKHGDDSTATEIHSLSPKLCENHVHEEDYVTLHLSSDEADLESSERKANDLDNSDSSDLDKIRQYIANCSNEIGIKTPFQKNLEKEGFNELIAKKIERDLTDSDVGGEDIYSPKSRNISSEVITSEIETHRDKLSEDSAEVQTVEPPESSATESNVKTQNSLEHAKDLMKSPNKVSTLSSSTHSMEKNTQLCGEHSKSEETDSFAEYTHKYEKNMDTQFTVNKCDESQALNTCKNEGNGNKHSLPPTGSSQAQSSKSGELGKKNSSVTPSKTKTHYRAKELISTSKGKSPYKIKSLIAEKNKLKSPNKKCSHTLSRVSPKKGRSKDKLSKSRRAKSKTVEMKSKNKAGSEKCKVSEKGFSKSVNKPGVSASQPQGPDLREKTGTESNSDDANAVVWSNFELNSSTPGFVKMVSDSKKKCKKPNQNPFDSVYTLSATIVNSETHSEEVRTIRITEFKELLKMAPNHYLKGHVQRREKKVLKVSKEKELDTQTRVSEKSLEVVSDEMSNSSPANNLQDITHHNKDNIENLLRMRNESEIRTAVSSILMEDDPATNPVFHTPYFLSTDNIDAACETLTRAIIEDEFVEKLNEKEPASFAVTEIQTGQEKNEPDSLMNFACVKSSSENTEVHTVENKTVVQNEKRKRCDEETDISSAKKPKLTPQHLLKEMGIESVLEKLHGP